MLIKVLQKGFLFGLPGQFWVMRDEERATTSSESAWLLPQDVVPAETW